MEKNLRRGRGVLAAARPNPEQRPGHLRLLLPRPRLPLLPLHPPHQVHPQTPPIQVLLPRDPKRKKQRKKRRSRSGTKIPGGNPVTTIQNRSRIVSIPKVLLINSLFAALTSLMVIFTSFTDSPFLGMLISLIFGKTDLFSDHPVMAFFVMGAIFWVCVLILALCFTWTSRLVNRKLSFLRALDTVSISSIYICFSDILIFLSVLFGSRGAFTLIFVAMVIMGICHFVSVKQDLALSDNSAFNMLVISYLLFYFLAQLGVNVLIRIFVLF